jgi:hypothetical protein
MEYFLHKLIFFKWHLNLKKNLSLEIYDIVNNFIVKFVDQKGGQMETILKKN